MIHYLDDRPPESLHPPFTRWGMIAERVEMGTQFDPWLTIRALCQYSGMSRKTISRWLNTTQHPIPHARVGGVKGKVLVKRSEFDAWMAKWMYSGNTRPAGGADAAGASAS
jgi:excisionase family DNA binding protein